MAPAENLHSALHALETAAYDLVTGRTRLDLPAVVALVATQPISGGAALLAVLLATAPHVEESVSARRQFFHAARAFVSLHRAHPMLEPSAWRHRRSSASAA